MNGQIAWLVILTILTLAQALVLTLRLAGNSKKNNPGNHGERIGKLETKVEEMDKDNEKDHGLIRKDIEKIFNLLNKKR